MFIVGNFLVALAAVLNIVLTLYMWVVIARAILSWVNPDPYNPIVRTIASMTDPVLYWIRSRLPVTFGGIDFSPIIVFLAIIFLKNFLVATLATMGHSML